MRTYKYEVSLFTDSFPQIESLSYLEMWSLKSRDYEYACELNALLVKKDHNRLFSLETEVGICKPKNSIIVAP